MTELNYLLTLLFRSALWRCVASFSSVLVVSHLFALLCSYWWALSATVGVFTACYLHSVKQQIVSNRQVN